MKKNRLLIFIFSLIVLSIILISILQAHKETSVNTKPFDDQKLVYLGDEDADNELLFLFDYSCPWCTRWIDEIFPEIESNFIDTGELKFRTQAMVFLNEASLQLADFDQNVKQYAEEHYHQIFTQLIFSQEQLENLETEAFVNDLIEEYQLDETTMLSEPAIDSIQLSRVYTRQLEVETVPTIYINGIKVEDPFDLEMIKRLIN